MQISVLLYFEMGFQMSLVKNRWEIQAPKSFHSFWNTRAHIGTAHNNLYTQLVLLQNEIKASLNSKLPSVGSLQKETARLSVNMFSETTFSITASDSASIVSNLFWEKQTKLTLAN